MMHPPNCACSYCLDGKIRHFTNYNKYRGFILVRNNVFNPSEFSLKCAVCGLNINLITDNYGIYEVLEQPANEPFFLNELCGELCMNLWRLKYAHYPIEVIDGGMKY